MWQQFVSQKQTWEEEGAIYLDLKRFLHHTYLSTKMVPINNRRKKGYILRTCEKYIFTCCVVVHPIAWHSLWCQLLRVRNKQHGLHKLLLKPLPLKKTNPKNVKHDNKKSFKKYYGAPFIAVRHELDRLRITVEHSYRLSFVYPCRSFQ